MNGGALVLVASVGDNDVHGCVGDGVGWRWLRWRYGGLCWDATKASACAKATS